MIPVQFDYVRATSLNDALKTLAGGDGTKVIAGGHSLIPLLRFRLAQPAKLLDIAGIKELSGISEYKRGLRIGAATTYRDILDSALVRDRYQVMMDATSGIGDVQVRNRGTIGGGVAHADPAADMPGVLLALGASFNLRSKRGKRVVAARDFFQGTFATALAEDELLIDMVVPPLPRGGASAYVSIEQAASGYALAGAAVVVKCSRKTVTECSLALTGLSDRAFLAEAAAKLLVGTKADPDTLQRVGAAAVEGIEITGDIHAPAEYRRHLAAVVVGRAIRAAIDRV